MIHVTLNTGNQERVNVPTLFSLDAAEGPLQEPYDRYSITALFIDSDRVYFDLAIDGEHISANMISQNNEAWQQIISLYLMIYNVAPPIPSIPPPTVWLATVILPNPKIFESQFTAQIEQAISLNLWSKSL